MSGAFYRRGLPPRRAYIILKCWYRHASARAPNLSLTDMEKVRVDYHTLFQREETHTPGLPLATHIKPAKVNDDILSEAEVEAAIQRVRPHRSGRNTHLFEEHLKKWQREAYPSGTVEETPRKGRDGCAW